MRDLMKRLYMLIRRRATIMRITVVVLIFAILLKNIHPRQIVRAFMQADPVFIVGQSFGSVIYLRNLTLIYRRRHLKLT